MHTLTPVLSKSNGNVPHNQGNCTISEIAQSQDCAAHSQNLETVHQSQDCTNPQNFESKHAVDSLQDGKPFIGSLLLPRCHNAIYNTELCHLSINSGRLLRGLVRSDSETMAGKPARQIHDRRGRRLSKDCGTTPLQNVWPKSKF